MVVNRDNSDKRMNTEIRRVQKTGASTLTVSLPKDWADLSGLKPGDQVAMAVQADGTIVLDPRSDRRKEAVKKEIWTDGGESAEHLKRKLIGAYLAGFNVIEVRSKERMDLETKRAARDFARMVIGPEVIEETANSIVLHDLSDPVELPQKKCVRRMHLIVDTMHRDAMIAYAQGDLELANDVIERDQDVDRLYWMTYKQYNLIQKDRSLAERVGVDIHESMSLMLVARLIERIGDHAEKIAKHALGSGKRGPAAEVGAIEKLSQEALVLLTKAMESYFLGDIGSANDIIDKAEGLVHKAEGLLPDLQAHNGKGAVSSSSVLDSVIRTIMYATDIAELAINESMRSEEK